MTKKVIIDWTPQEDSLLMNGIIELRASGAKIVESFDTMSLILCEKFGNNRTPDAVNYRYYQIRNKFKNGQVKYRTPVLVEAGLPVPSKIILEKAKNAPVKETVIDIVDADNFIEMLERSKQLLIALKQRDITQTAENERLQKELERSLNEARQLKEDNETYMKIFDRARHIMVSEELGEIDSSKFKMSRNGNLERVSS